MCGPCRQGACSPLSPKPKVTAKSAFHLPYVLLSTLACTLPPLPEMSFRKMKSRYLFWKRARAPGLRKSCSAIPLVALAPGVRRVLTRYLLTTGPHEALGWASVRTGLYPALDLGFLIGKMWSWEQTVPSPKYQESFFLGS